jgi:hypothetical protein
MLHPHSCRCPAGAALHPRRPRPHQVQRARRAGSGAPQVGRHGAAGGNQAGHPREGGAGGGGAGGAEEGAGGGVVVAAEPAGGAHPAQVGAPRRLLLLLSRLLLPLLLSRRLLLLLMMMPALIGMGCGYTLSSLFQSLLHLYMLNDWPTACPRLASGPAWRLAPPGVWPRLAPAPACLPAG